MSDGLPAWLARGWLIGQVSMRRHVRKARQHPWIAFFQGFAVLFGAVVAVGAVPVPVLRSLWNQAGGYVLGTLVATEGPLVVELLRGFCGVVFLLLVFLTTLKEVTEGAMDAHVDALLLSAGPRSVAAGNLVWNLLLTSWQFGALVLAGALAFGVGSGSAAATVTLVLAGVALVLTAVPLGYAVALTVKLAFRRVPAIREHPLAFGAPLAAAYFGLFVRLRESMQLLGATPAGWFADLGLVFQTGAADPLNASLALAGAPLSVLLIGGATVPLGERVWYGDPPREAGETTSATPSTGDGALAAVASRPTAAVTRTVWRRLRREPRTLVFAALPIALVGSAGVELVGRQPESLPVVIGVYGGAAVGMGATLNPLGSLGAGLPAALTTPDGGRHLVRGYALSAALPGAPVVAALSAAGAVTVGLGVPLSVALGLLAGLLATTAAVVSMAVGVALPNMEGLRPTGSGIRPPRLWATTVFLSVMALVGTPALVGVGWADPVAARTGASAVAVVAGGLCLTAGVAGLASLVAYRRALSTIGDYTVE